MPLKNKFNQKDYDQVCFLFGILTGAGFAKPDPLTILLQKMQSLLVDEPEKKHVKTRH